MTQENIEKIREGLRQLDDCRQVIDEINSNEQ